MSSSRTAVSRRRFLTTAAQAGAVLSLPQFVPGKALGMSGAVAPSQRIVLGGIGLGPRGTADLRCFLSNSDLQFVAICDVQQARREAIKKLVDETYGNTDCELYSDMHEILARQDIDAMLIATGDRWHTMAAITAARAGKDVYCEKPCSMTISESRALSDTYRRYGRIYQAGTQRRSIGNFLFAAELAHTGKLGKLKTVHANTLHPATAARLFAGRNRCQRRTKSTGCGGLGRVRGGATARNTPAAAGGATSTSMGAGSWNGAPIRSTSASGRHRKTTPPRLSMFRRGAA